MILSRFAGDRMKRFVEGTDRGQSALFPECLDDWIDEDNPVRVIDVFVDKLALGELGFGGIDPKATGRPSYHPTALLKLYIYGYLNRVQSSRRLEREAGRNVEVMWLTGRLVPDQAVNNRDKNFTRAKHRSRRALPAIYTNSTAPTGRSLPWRARQRQPASQRRSPC
jgi:transposase